MDDLAIALHLADLADERVMDAFHSERFTARPKPDGSLVSSVDLAVELDLLRALKELRPHDSVLGEETTGFGSGARQWVIDPIDHTNNFVRGVPVFGTLIALVEKGTPTVGVVSAPPLARRWWAMRGKGAFTDGGRRIRVSSVDGLPEAYLSFAALHLWHRSGHLDALVGLTGGVRNVFGSGGFWAHMLVAEGRLDVSLDPWGKLWDLAPIQVIVEEAGGRLTDLDGRARSDGGCAVVTNGLLHEEVLATLRRTPPG